MYNPVSPPKPDSDPESADEASCSDDLIIAMKEKTTLPKPNLKETSRRSARETPVGKRSEPKRSKKKPSPKKSAGDFSCPHCTKSFKIERSFTLHVRYTHELYKCDVCGITLVGWNQLKYHEVRVLVLFFNSHVIQCYSLSAQGPFRTKVPVFLLLEAIPREVGLHPSRGVAFEES